MQRFYAVVAWFAISLVVGIGSAILMPGLREGTRTAITLSPFLMIVMAIQHVRKSRGEDVQDRQVVITDAGGRSRWAVRQLVGDARPYRGSENASSSVAWRLAGFLDGTDADRLVRYLEANGVGATRRVHWGAVAYLTGTELLAAVLCAAWLGPSLAYDEWANPALLVAGVSVWFVSNLAPAYGWLGFPGVPRAIALHVRG